MNDIFDEVTNELKQEKITGLLNKYLPYIICIIVVIIAATSFYVLWQKHLTAKREELGDIYNKTQILLKQEDAKSIMESLDYLIKNDNSGYLVLAQFKKAQVLTKEKNFDQALAIYDSIEKDKSLDLAIRDLSLLLATSIMVEQKQDDQKLMAARFIKLENIHNPFRGSALLLKAVWMLQKNDITQANELLQSLVKDDTIIESIRKKAEELLAVI